MVNSEFYNAIFRRKSIRKYKREPLEGSRLEELNRFIEELVPLYKDINTEVVIMSNKDIKLLLPIKSPHYIAVYSQVRDGYLPNVGFMLQQLDLYLSSKGIGTCWLGMGLPQKESASRNGMEFVITMAFGYPDEPLHRASITEFKRRPLSDISSVSGAKDLLEAARLAPSASNTQPWFFSGSEDHIIISRKVPNILKEAVYGKFNRIDVGIAMCHLWIAAQYHNKTVDFKVEEQKVPKGNEYIASAYIKQA